MKKLLCCLLGISIITVTTATSGAAGVMIAADEPMDTAPEENGAFVSYFIDPYVDKDDPDIVCPEGFERIPCDRGVVFRSKATETPDLTKLTPVETSEYINGDFYVVEDVYVTDEYTKETATTAADSWEYKTVTVKHSIYEDPDKNYGTLVATMIVTAQFKWNGTTAMVVGTPSCYTTTEAGGKNFMGTGKSIEKYDIAKDCRSDQGSNYFFGNKYAYVEYIVRITYPINLGSTNLSMDFRLYVSVNRNGKMNTED